MAKTTCILIGNSDNKLTQMEWASFVMDLDQEVEINFSAVYFSGSPPSTSIRQNYCVVGELRNQAEESRLFDELDRLRQIYRQDSIAVVIGDTVMVK